MPTVLLDNLRTEPASGIALAPTRSDIFDLTAIHAPESPRWSMIKEDDLEDEEFLDDDDQDDDFLEDDDDDDDFLDDDDDDDEDDFLDDDDDDDDEELIDDEE